AARRSRAVIAAAAPKGAALRLLLRLYTLEIRSCQTRMLTRVDALAVRGRNGPRRTPRRFPARIGARTACGDRPRPLGARLSRTGEGGALSRAALRAPAQS